MSGILDKKSRVLDSIVTFEGRKQLAQGKLKITYASFSDAATYYSADLASGSTDATIRLYLESSNLPQDQITFKADDSGLLQPFGTESEISVRAGQLTTYQFSPTTSTTITGSSSGMTTLSGSTFASTIDGILTSSFDNFNKLYTIATHDNLFGNNGFAVGPDSAEFVIHNERPLPDANSWTVNVNHLESLFNDPRLSRLKNFNYLPPVNKVQDASIDKSDYRNTSPHQLGIYEPWGRPHTSELSYDIIKQELGVYEKLGYMKSFNFDPTSKDNNLVGQFFELSYDSAKKLDVIDFGKFYGNNSQNSISHIFFVGKILIDDNDTQTFVHLFTLVFE